MKQPNPDAAAEVLKLAESAREKLRVDPRESLRLAEEALALAQNEDDARSRALALRAKANALWFLNENRSAVELYARAAGIFEELGDRTEVGRTLSSGLQPLIRLGEYAQAAENAGRAREIFTESGDGHRLARLELNFANVLHRQDRFAEAEAGYERAYRQLVLYQDTEGVAVALHNMAVCLIVLNDFPKALATYAEARAFYEAHGMPALVAQADYNVAYLYYLRGDYSRGLALLRAAHEAAERSGDGYHCALCSMDESEIYLELNMNEEAAEAAEKALTGFEALGCAYEAGKSTADLAIAAGRMGQTARALERFAKARTILVREGNPVWPSLLDVYQALLLLEAGQAAEAGRLCSAALEAFRGRSLTAKEVVCLLVLARVALCDGRPDAARGHCNQALRLLETLEAPHLEWQAQFVLGQAEEAAGQPGRAEACYRAARSAAESLRGILRGEELKIAFMQGKQEIFEALVRLCLPRPEEAFAFVEEAKSRALRDLLFSGAEPAPALQSAAGAEIRNLCEDLNWYYRRIELEEAGPEPPSSERLQELDRLARERENRLAGLLRTLPLEEQESAGFRCAPALPLETVREALGPDATMVEYFRTGDQIVAAVLSQSELRILPLAAAARVEELARLLRFQFSKFRLGPEYTAAYSERLLEGTRGHLRELYRALVAPLEPFLAAPRLVLVPHESLHQLPLHALFDGRQYLIDRFAITYAPSAAIYALCRERCPNRSAASLVLGIPDPRAPWIGHEADAVALVLPDSRLFTGAEATRQVLEEHGPASRLLHIASHGRFREDHPMFSAIRLGDGYLTIYDLYRLRLPVDLAVLSGCSTGLSAVASGDELLGLVRGLLHAGARSLLLTLWDVQDRTTAEFMTGFYGRFPRHPDKAGALQQAMQELRARHPHPYYWAPFVLVGSPN